MNIISANRLNSMRLLVILMLILIPTLTIIGSFFYPGSKVLFLIYGLLITLTAISILIKRISYFSFFFFIFIIIGCWLKIILHFFLDNAFIEPVGKFNNSPEAWDAAIRVLTVAFSALLISYWLSALFSKRIKPLSHYFKGSSYLWPLLILTFFWTVALLVFNYHFSILKIGVEPLLKLPSYLYAIVAFMVAWGDALLIAALTYWLIEAKLAKVTLMFYLIGLEGALTAISMGSRVQMILHVSVPFVIYLFKVNHLKKYERSKIIIVVGSLFVISLFVVSVDRFQSFQSATLVQNSVSHQSAKSLPPPPKGLSQPYFWQRTLHQLSTLIIDRWIGIEGVLAVSSDPMLSAKLLYAGLVEDPKKGTDAIYQKMAGSYYQKYQNFTFMTIPGPIAFLYLSGSLFVVAIGMVLLYFIGHIIESMSTVLIQNKAVNAMTGVALAYLFVQINFPMTCYFFLIELIGFLGGLAIFQLILKNYPFKFFVENKNETQIGVG